MRAPDTLPPAVQRDLDAMDAAVAGRAPDGGDALLAELAALLPEDRPAPDPQWARTLDTRAAAGFAKPGGARARRRLTPRWFAAPAAGLAACAAIALAISLAGAPSQSGENSGGGGSASSTSGGSTAAQSESSKAAPAPRSAPPVPSGAA